MSGVSIPIHRNHQTQQTLLLAEHQEQERLATEKVEAERIAAEEQARL